MQRKRHSAEEVSEKLQEARRLAQHGKLQSDIARALGVSIMTLHRWRKADQLHERESGSNGHRTGTDAPASEPNATSDEIAELQAENARLRKLVTDFLLEKVKLEEALRLKSAPAKARTK